MNYTQKLSMLKEVGASGQISLGKKYSGQLFDVVVQPDGSIVMSPVKVVPAPLLLAPKDANASQSTQEWASTNAPQIAAYNTWASNREPYSQRVRRWREQGT